MRFRFSFFIIILLGVGGLGYYFLVSSSYQNSLRAKVLYIAGDYQLAHKLAKEAYEEDHYNRMAATVMTHSTLALEYIAFIDEAKKYKETIAQISKKEYVVKADKLRMKFMAEIIMDRYGKLTDSVVIDKSLKAEARMLYDTFKQVHEKVSRSL